jgi:hypothetical protein
VNKKLILLAMSLVMALGLLAGCSSKSTASTTPTGTFKIIRKATLNTKWQMYQFELNIPVNGAFDIDLLGMANSDKADGYFYQEKGSASTLTITAGSTIIYNSAATAGVTSDRFSFSATLPLGNAYVLNFRNTGSDATTVFVEVIYPATANIRGPLDVK